MIKAELFILVAVRLGANPVELTIEMYF